MPTFVRAYCVTVCRSPAFMALAILLALHASYRAQAGSAFSRSIFVPTIQRSHPDGATY